MNSVKLLGRLVKDPVLREINATLSVASFTIATDKKISREKKEELKSKGKSIADFHNIEVIGSNAQNCIKYLGKGCRVLVEGRLTNNSYKTEKDGITYMNNVSVITAESINFIDMKDSKNSNDDFPEISFEDGVLFNN